MTDRWPNVRLAEVLTLSPEPHDVLVDAEYPNVGMYSYARGLFLKRPIAGSATSAKVLFRVKKDQFIYSRLFAFEGAYGVVPAQFDGTFVSNEYPTFDVDRSRLLPHFLELYFKQPTVWEAVAKASTGVGHRRQRVPPSGVLSATIPLPPLSVQQAAVSRVEAIAGRIEEAKRLRGESKAATEALLESAISARLEELSSCTTAPLAELTTKVGSGSTPAGGRAAYPGSGIPFIRSMNVRMRRFQYNDLVYISADTHRTMSGTRVQPLDVLLNITGASIGRVANAPISLEEANVNQHVAIIRPTEDLDPRFLMYWLSHSATQDVILEKQKGATRQALTKSQIEAMQIPTISLARQRQIVTDLDVLKERIDEGLVTYAEGVQLFEAAMPAVLDKAFRGEM